MSDKANKAEAEAKAKAEAEAKAKAEAEAKAKAELKLTKGQATVGEKHSICTKAGVKTAGQVVNVSDLSGGQETFDRLVKAKVLVK